MVLPALTHNWLLPCMYSCEPSHTTACCPTTAAPVALPLALWPSSLLPHAGGINDNYAEGGHNRRQHVAKAESLDRAILTVRCRGCASTQHFNPGMVCSLTNTMTCAGRSCALCQAGMHHSTTAVHKGKPALTLLSPCDPLSLPTIGIADPLIPHLLL